MSGKSVSYRAVTVQFSAVQCNAVKRRSTSDGVNTKLQPTSFTVTSNTHLTPTGTFILK